MCSIISFGNSLIKTVVQEISKNNPQIRNFVTLSPLPNFTKWLKENRAVSKETAKIFKTNYEAEENLSMVINKAQVKKNILNKKFQLIDISDKSVRFLRSLVMRSS